MLHTLAVAAALTALAPAQAGLSLSNDRLTFGELGPVRADNRLLPGDVFYLAFDIDGLTADDSGKVQYTMAMELTDSTGASIFKREPTKQEEYLILGGTKLPARAYVLTPYDQKPGTYTCKMTVTDLNSKASKTLDKAFEIVPPAFGPVRVLTTNDPDGQWPTPALGITGQFLWVHFEVAHFVRDKTSKQPNVTMQVRVLDEAGQPTMAKSPMVHEAKENIDEKVKGIPDRFLIPMNRAGKFTIEITTEDKLGGKSARALIPLTVLPAPK